VKLATTYRLWLGAFPALVALAVVGAVLTAMSNHESNPVTMAVVLPVIGMIFVVGGLIARTIRPDNGTGLLLTLVGFLWLINAFWEANNRWILGLAAVFGSLFLGAFVHLMLAYPEGRLASRLERRLIAGLWATAFLAGALPAIFDRQFDECKGCPDNPFLVGDHPDLANVLQAVFTVLGVVIFLGILVLLLRRWGHATPAQRQVLGPVYFSGGLALVLVTGLFLVDSFSNAAGNVLGVAAFTAFGAVPLFFLAGLLRTRLYRAGARLLREVPDEPTMEQIQTGFRSVLGDPTLEYLTWLEETGGYVDIRCNPRGLPPDTPRRVTTRIDSESDRPLAALVHDAALLHQQALLDEVVSTARLAIQKDRGLEALRRSESRSRALLDAIPDLMFRIARDGTYLEAKGRRESLVRPVEEIIGRTVNELLPADVAAQFIHALAQPPDAGVQTVEYRLTIEGVERWFEGRLVPSGDDEVVVIVRDFTDRRRLEYELERRLETVQREQAFTRAVVNVAPVIFLLVDPEGRIVRFNDHTRRLFGVEDDERVRGKPWWDVFLPAENRPGAQANIARVNSGADEVELEAEWQAGDGPRRVIRSTVLRVYDGEGNLRFLICGQDLTELVAQRAEVETQRDFLSAVGRATPSLLVIVDSDGVVADEGVNYAFRELTGYSDPDAIGKPFWDLVAPPELVDEVKEAFDEQVATGRSLEHETAWIGRAGQWRIVAWWLRPLGQGVGKYVVCGVDVTERKAQEAELRASRSRIVEAADAARRRLERNLHDGAQQRLVSLSLALRLAQGKVRDDPEGAEQILGAAGEELTQALAELRELARGIHPAVLTDRGLPAALEALAARAQLPVELSTSLDGPLPGPVEAAAYYVVSEALANVAKYADASVVQVRAERQNGRVLVEVADDGIGGADPLAGSGLRGLADRIEALDGRLEVDSPVGAGTRVRAVIPLSAS
jgi:PAS domain S-box-containing protein